MRRLGRWFSGFVLAFALAPALHAQSLNALGVARLNQDVQQLWVQDGVPILTRVATAELQKLVGVPHALNGNLTATIVGLNSLRIDAAAPPGLRRLDQGGMDAGLPLAGSWAVTADVEVHVKGRVLFVNVDQTFSTTIALSEIVAGLSGTFDSSDPAAPRLAHVNPPVVRFKLTVRSTNVLVNALGFIGSGLVDSVGRVVVIAASEYLAWKLGGLTAGTPSVMNSGGPGLAPVARGDLEQAAAKLGDELERVRTPFGPVLEMQFDTPYSGTWADSLADPHFTPGNPIGQHAYGDSGEMTGNYLASLAFRYATTRDPVARTRAVRALATLRTLLTMRGEPGNMNRSIMPVAYLPDWQRPAPGYTPGHDYALPWGPHGELYYFSDYMSRDEYTGLFYGLSFAHDLFDDPALKAEAQAQMELALDYLVRNGWTWRRRDGSYGERWQGVLDQQYAWILATWHGNPAKYQALHDQYRGFTDLLWTGYWTAAIDPYNAYYKFQLGLESIHVLLAHETDPAGWMRAYQAVAILRHYIGHHLNAQFNDTYLAFDPSARASLGAQNENLLSRWLLWPRRRQRVDLHGDPSIEKIQYVAPLSDPSMLLPNGPPPKPVEIAKYPLPPDRRIGSGNMWSVSPCQLDPGFPVGPDATIEGETLDFVLPYWMSRYYGAIVPPRTGPGPIDQPGTRPQ